MNDPSISTITERTLAGTVSFPEVVAALLAAGVEYYHVDYVGMRQTCYSAAGAIFALPLGLAMGSPVAPDFDAAALKAAIFDSQNHGQKFADFSRRAREAGVQGYYVFLRGQRVTYLGRQGDQHVEWFPGARP